MKRRGLYINSLGSLCLGAVLLLLFWRQWQLVWLLKGFNNKSSLLDWEAVKYFIQARMHWESLWSKLIYCHWGLPPQWNLSQTRGKNVAAFPWLGSSHVTLPHLLWLHWRWQRVRLSRLWKVPCSVFTIYYYTIQVANGFQMFLLDFLLCWHNFLLCFSCVALNRWFKQIALSARQ